MGTSLILDSPVLLWEKTVDKKNHINVMEGRIIRLGNILELFNESGKIGSVGFPYFFLFERVQLMKRQHAP